MATEVCDCDGTCKACNPDFHPEYLSIEIVLRGHKGEKPHDYLWNGAFSHIFIDGDKVKLTKKFQREVANKIAKMLKVKATHSV